MRKISILGLTSVALASSALAQIPDIVNAFDAGSRSLGAGSSLGVTGADTMSTFSNPAGLAYISSRTLGVSYRNLPTSNTRIAGNLANPLQTSEQDRGSNGITHLGYALPMSSFKKGAEGTIGIAYTVGGFLDDTRTGTGLQSGNLTVNNYIENIKARTDFFTLAFAKTSKDQNFSFGVGLNYVRNSVSNTVSGQLSNNLPFNSTDVSETGQGFGLTLGAQFIPKGRPDTSYGLTVRTPVKINNNPITGDIYGTIPGVISLGTAWRKDNLRGGNDFIVYGAQVNHFFGGSGSTPIDRTNQTTFGVGLEYNLSRDSATIPIRLGYIAVPRGGNGFGDRSAFTVGVGYRPNNSPYSIDLNYAYPRSGSSDVSLGLTYRFDK